MEQSQALDVNANILQHLFKGEANKKYNLFFYHKNMLTNYRVANLKIKMLFQLLLKYF